MNAKAVTVVVGLLLLVPAGFAADAQFGDCPTSSADGTNQYDCDEVPDDGGPFPPHAVTAHTVYASFVINNVMNNTLGLPTDFGAVAGYFEFNKTNLVAKQRECVVWFNGYNLDQRPDPDSFGWGAENAFPSDEDQPLPPGGVPNHDQAYQDYDFDRDIENCVPVVNATTIVEYANFAVVVEQGDCDPASGDDFRFRGHLDFVDPNNIYHEVQEYDYVCGGLFDTTGPRNVVPAGLGLGSTVGDLVKDMFPYATPYNDPHNFDGCDAYETPVDNTDIPGGGTDPGHFDLGHKCNGSVQDLFTERMWITEFHAIVTDPTILQPYNFALQFDTCAGINIYEVQGKDAFGAANGYDGATVDPQAGGGTQQLDTYHDIAYHTYYGQGLDAFLDGWPLYDVCTDGSSFSFDDTPRGRVVHSGPPGPIGSTDIMRGNSYDFDPGSDTFGKHRTNCRVNAIDWPYNTFPPGPPAVADDCYPEDHKTAVIDIYVYDVDPTGLWAVNTNGLTGLNAYVGPGLSTGPDYVDP